MEKIKQITSAQWLFLISLAVVIFVVYNIVLAFTRIGEIKTEINVVPQDAKVTINDKPSSSGSVYLAAGEYTFSAAAEGWETDTQKININKDRHEVYLLPGPTSEEAKNWLKNNPDVQAEREAFGGKKFDAQNQKAAEQNPILQYLPYTSESPPFTINYGPSKERKGDIYLLINDASPNGRQAALDWIRSQGQDPTDMQIIFAGFDNPLGKGVERY
ncbi:MAG TPA: hypothetical protein VFW77_02425 [Candidatus Saccharimonadales bacterium]|nr:hypothetical protein [Candidatus Saccharimonadales bacterium]